MSLPIVPVVVVAPEQRESIPAGRRRALAGAAVDGGLRWQLRADAAATARRFAP